MGTVLNDTQFVSFRTVPIDKKPPDQELREKLSLEEKGQEK